MKVVLLIVVLVVVAGGAFMVIQNRQRDQAIEDLRNRKERVIQFDSIRTVIEARIYDSLAVSLKATQATIEDLKRQQKRTSDENKELRRLYNSNAVSLPEF